MAKVSIIIPAYNSEKHIGKCLDSIFSKTHDDLEVEQLEKEIQKILTKKNQ